MTVIIKLKIIWKDKTIFVKPKIRLFVYIDFLIYSEESRH